MNGRRRLADRMLTRRLRSVVILLLTLAAFMPASHRAEVYGLGADAAPSASVQANIDDELVYLDASGVIKVYDPRPSIGVPEVQWQSPGGGWSGIALGDFNADGDKEIVAISGGGVNRLVIFDPVAEGVDAGDADGVINGIPWRILYEETLAGPPLLVASGNFDLVSPADEFIYYYTLPAGDVVQSDDPYRFVVRVAEGSPPDGRSWSTMISHDSGNLWNKIIPGNYDGAGVDEVALIASETGNLSVYRLSDTTLERIRRTVNAEAEWQDADSGQFVAGGQEELALGREADLYWSTLIVSHFVTHDDWPDDFAEHNNPPPREVFMGDIGGNGDDEVIALREVPSNLTGRARLFVRDNGNDTIGIGELALDADNGYQAGVAGDIDGDGRDEIIAMRNNRIRVFTEPEKSSVFEDHSASTGSEVILAGNLDAGGLTGSSRLGVSPDSVEDTVVSGSISADHVLSISDVVNGRSLPFTSQVEGGSEWIELSASSSTTPATLNVTLDATDLISGTHTDRIVIDTSDSSILNAPFLVDVSMTVVPGVAVAPSEIMALEDCADGGREVSYPVAVQGTEDATFTVSQPSPVSWASASPLTGTVPSEIEVTLDSGELASGYGTTQLVVRAGVGNEEAAAALDVYLLCVESTVLLPFTAH